MLIGFIALYLLLTLLVGWWASHRVHNTRDFAVAGSNLPLLVAASALFATWFGSETILGASSEFVEHGLLGVIEDPFGAALCLLLVGAFFARPLYRLQILTFNDFFRMRFSRTAELVSALFMIPSYFGWIAAQLVALAVMFQVLAGIPLVYGIISGALIVVFYTFIGGMWAVSVTDAIQTVVIISGLFILSSLLLRQIGDWETILSATPTRFFRFIPDPGWHNYAHYLAAWITIGLGSIPQQDVFQRVMAARNVDTAVRASYLAGLLYLTIGLLPLFISLCASILYPGIGAGDAQGLIPALVMRHGNLGLQILFFGALVSAILSTTAGAMLAPATVLGENIIRPLLESPSDQLMLRAMRLSVVFVGVCSALMAMASANIYDLVAQSSALSLVSLFVPLVGGLYWKRSSDTGALMAMGAGMTTWIGAEFLVHSEIPSLLWGTLAAIIGMIAGSLFFPDNSYLQFLQAKVGNAGKVPSV